GVQPGGYRLVLNAPQTGGGVMQIEIAKIEVGKQALEHDFSIAAARPGILRGKVGFDRMHLPSGRLLLALENASRLPSPFPMALGARLTGPKTVVAANGSFEIHAAPGEYRLLAMDLATGVLLHRSEDSVTIKAGKVTASRLEVSLAFARITLAPVVSGGRMARVSRLQVEVDSPGNPANVRIRPVLANIDRGHGLLLAPGEGVVELFLPCFETRVLARSAAYHLVGMGTRARAPALGEIEFLPNPAKTTKVVLPVGPPTDY
ncbi:MAG: hypothetical protein VX259_00690, partial [Pseudomonadota bacterium]|nr:hypothetical protein [Pseudomonadota bacterium]